MTYQRARLTSDFTVAALLRFIVPSLTLDQIIDLANGAVGTREVYALAKTWLNGHITFSACPTSPEVAIATEEHAARRA